MRQKGSAHGLLFGASRTTFSGERIQRLRTVQRQCRDALRDVYFQGAHGGLLFGRVQGQRRGELNCTVADGVLPLRRRAFRSGWPCVLSFDKSIIHKNGPVEVTYLTGQPAIGKCFAAGADNMYGNELAEELVRSSREPLA